MFACQMDQIQYLAEDKGGGSALGIVYIVYEDENCEVHTYPGSSDHYLVDGKFNMNAFFKNFPGCHLSGVFAPEDSLVRENKSSFTIWRNRRKWEPVILRSPFNQLDENNGADPVVIRFINDFYSNIAKSPEEQEVLRGTFMSGYCYFFAHMLKEAFNSGEVCWCAPYGHFVWCNDYKGETFAYDVEGVSIASAEFYIPEYYLGNLLDDFKHVPGKVANATRAQIDAVVKRYLADIDEEIPEDYAMNTSFFYDKLGE